MNRFLLIGLFLVTLATAAFPMEYEKIRMTVWRKGETIAGEEFIAANEGVMDYISKLHRPTELLKGIRYSCLAKGQYIRPTVRGTQIGNQNEWVEIRTVYELKDCVETQ